MEILPKAGQARGLGIEIKGFFDQERVEPSDESPILFRVGEYSKKNDCHVYAVYFDKLAATKPIAEDWIVPLSFQRLVEKFDCELQLHNTIGTIVCDWSTHKLDRHVCDCVQSHVIAQKIHTIVGGVTYGSSRSLALIQVCDLVSGAVRITQEGGSHLGKFWQELYDLKSDPSGMKDCRGFSCSSVTKLF